MVDASGPAVRRVPGYLLLRLRWVVWNTAERRPRAPIRLVAGLVLFFVLAGAGNQYRPRPFTGNGAIVEALNMLTWQIPNALGLALAVVVAALVVDRRHLSDLGFAIDRQWWREILGGTMVGAGISMLTVLVGLGIGYYEFTGVGLTTEPGSWVVIAVGAALFQLLFVVPEELFVRGYLITNITEGLDSISAISRRMAAGVAILVSSGFFYLTHAVAKGTTFGLMVAVWALLLGLGYVLSGNLSVPIGIHFGVNFTGVLAGVNPQPASLLKLSTATTIQESLVLPSEAVVIRSVGVVIGIAVLGWWYHAHEEGIRVALTIPKPTLRWHEYRNPTDD
ncbi:CPBP family intramembrane glutamic endopeptidase [Haloarcula amylovorans]|uniref:CPBP family intramembrane glutamic endopeptidase n=1 Tax=Haloarcula amylovorans TaxID=2562280 RepID=UPI001076A0F5|nr:CPBP family intramembrane glutamic endopeptidase [Halomicroarcula amylolytica]